MYENPDDFKPRKGKDVNGFFQEKRQEKEKSKDELYEFLVNRYCTTSQLSITFYTRISTAQEVISW